MLGRLPAITQARLIRELMVLFPPLESLTILGVLDRHLEQTAEFPRKVHGNARVHGALSVQEALRTAESEYTFVPDVGVNVESLSATEAEAHKTLRGHVIARERQRDIERSGV